MVQSYWNHWIHAMLGIQTEQSEAFADYADFRCGTGTVVRSTRFLSPRA